MEQLISNPKLAEEREEKRQEILEERIKAVGDYIIETGASYRVAGTKFGISAPTVLSYCKKYKKMFPINAEKLECVISENKEKTVTDEIIKKRVLNNAKLVLEGNTIEEVANITKTDYWVVYRDLTVRLKQINEKLYINIEKVFYNRSINNLKNQAKK